MRTLTRAGVAVAASSAVMLLAPVAHATDGTTTIHLRQTLPLTATSEGVENGDCPGISEDKDGWHFVLPGKDGDFVKLTVTFSPGGTQVITDFSGFGNPEGKHAYVASEPGAQLTDAVAEIKGSVPQDLFNLSHTCPAEEEEQPSGSASPSTSPSTQPSGSTSASPSQSATETATPSPSASASESASVVPTAAPSQQGGSGDLAETGNGAPVGALSAVAAVLVAAGGGLLFFRRRKAQQG